MVCFQQNKVLEAPQEEAQGGQEWEDQAGRRKHRQCWDES